LDEASDISLYLQTLRPHVEKLSQGGDLIELVQAIIPLFHTISLIWQQSKHYNTPNRLSILLREVANDVVEQAKGYMSNELFNIDPEEATEKIRVTSRFCETFRAVFYAYRTKLSETSRPWYFDAKPVFSRLERFSQRVKSIGELFETIIEFMRLEKIEVGGTKGKILSSQVVTIFNEFSTAMQTFKSIKYDILCIGSGVGKTPQDEILFDQDVEKFRKTVDDLDRRVGYLRFSLMCMMYS
jgi:dynein heavy chain